MTITTGDTVTVEYTGRLDDGTVFDTSRASVAEETGLAAVQPDREYEPLTLEIGTERVIEGLETALIGLETGAAPTVTMPPEKAYGERSEDRIQEYGAEAFSDMVGGEIPEAGDYVETEAGSLAEIVHVDEETVRVDFNHELAGEILEFDIEVLSVNGE